MKIILPSHQLSLLTATILLLFSTLSCAGNKADIPSPREVEYEWMSIEDWQKQHQANVVRAQQGNIDLLFLGDSITQGWTWGDNSNVFSRAFGAYKTANFGIGGDQTQHLLWRLQNSPLDKVHPKVTVMMIGVNNFGHSQHSAEEVSIGVKANIDFVHKRFPNTKILLLAVLPFDEQPTSWNRVAVASTNQKLAQFANEQTIFYYDLGYLFINERGKIPKALMADFLHPTTEGYNKIAAVLAPAIATLME